MTRMNWPFVGIPSFLRAPICTDLDKLDADIAIMGVLFDEGVPFMPGSRFGLSEFRAGPPDALAQTLPKDAPCYVSIDVDVLDLPLVPGCVSAEPNGMTYTELRDCLDGIARHLDVIGFDFVEVNPQLDVGTGVTSYLGAHTVIEFLGRITEQSRWIERRSK